MNILKESLTRKLQEAYYLGEAAPVTKIPNMQRVIINRGGESLNLMIKFDETSGTPIMVGDVYKLENNKWSSDKSVSTRYKQFLKNAFGNKHISPSKDASGKQTQQVIRINIADDDTITLTLGKSKTPYGNVNKTFNEISQEPSNDSLDDITTADKFDTGGSSDENIIFSIQDGFYIGTGIDGKDEYRKIPEADRKTGKAKNIEYYLGALSIGRNEAKIGHVDICKEDGTLFLSNKPVGFGGGRYNEGDPVPMFLTKTLIQDSKGTSKADKYTELSNILSNNDVKRIEFRNVSGTGKITVITDKKKILLGFGYEPFSSGMLSGKASLTKEFTIDSKGYKVGDILIQNGGTEQAIYIVAADLVDSNSSTPIFKTFEIEVAKGKIQGTPEEIQRTSEYDYVIINDDIDMAASVLKQIAITARIKIPTDRINAFVQKWEDI